MSCLNSNKEALTTHMLSKTPSSAVCVPYVETLPQCNEARFTTPPIQGINDAKIELSERQKHPLKDIGYRGAAINYRYWGATFVGLKIRIGDGRVYQHAINGTRHSILHAKESQLVVYEKDKDYQLGVVIDGYFYAIYMSHNGVKLFLSRVPQSSLNATLYNYDEFMSE